MSNESANWHNQGDVDKIRELEAELKQAENAYNEMCGGYEAENERLKEALQEYGWHKNSCAYVQGLRGNSIDECDCGFSQVLKESNGQQP